MAKQRTEKGQAAHILDAELSKIEYDLDAATVTADEILQEYFSHRPDRLDDREEQYRLLFDYSRNAKKMRIVFHFLSDAMDKIRALLEEMENRIESEAEQ